VAHASCKSSIFLDGPFVWRDPQTPSTVRRTTLQLGHNAKVSIDVGGDPSTMTSTILRLDSAPSRRYAARSASRVNGLDGSRLKPRWALTWWSPSS